MTALQQPDRVTVQMLGTGVPLPGSPFRCSSAAAIFVGGEWLVFDAGRGVVQQSYAAGIPLESYSRAFLTHHHYDHIGDLADLTITSWLSGRRSGFEVFGPRGTRQIVSGLFDQVYALDIEFRSKGEPMLGGWPGVTAHEPGPGLMYSGRDYEVIAHEVQHPPGVAIPGFEERWQCFGYRIETPEGSVVISGDGVPSEGMAKLCEDADLLILCCYMAPSEIDNDYRRMLAESTLLSADRAGTFAKEVGAKRVVLTHTRPKSLELLQEMTEKVSADFGGPVTVAEDLSRYAL